MFIPDFNYRINQLRLQRESDSSQGKRHSANSTHSLPTGGLSGLGSGSGGSSSGTARQYSAHVPLLPETSSPFTVTQRDMSRKNGMRGISMISEIVSETEDFTYDDPMGTAISRPKTGARRALVESPDEEFEFDESLLPD